MRPCREGIFFPFRTPRSQYIFELLYGRAVRFPSTASGMVRFRTYFHKHVAFPARSTNIPFISTLLHRRRGTFSDHVESFFPFFLPYSTQPVHFRTDNRTRGTFSPNSIGNGTFLHIFSQTRCISGPIHEHTVCFHSVTS